MYHRSAKDLTLLLSSDDPGNILNICYHVNSGNELYRRLLLNCELPSKFFKINNEEI